LLDALLFNSLEGAEDWFDSFDLFGKACDSLLLDFDFELKLVLLEDLALNFTCDVTFDLSCFFNLVEGIFGVGLILG
jgi:hypothetical protein